MSEKSIFESENHELQVKVRKMAAELQTRTLHSPAPVELLAKIRSDEERNFALEKKILELEDEIVRINKKNRFNFS